MIFITFELHNLLITSFNFRRRMSPPINRKRVTLPHWSSERKTYRKRSRSPVTRYQSPARRSNIMDRSSRHRKFCGTLHSDRIMSR